MDGYVTSPDGLVLLPGAADAVARITRAGCPTVLVTNQRAIARGLLGRGGLEEVHSRLEAELSTAGGRLDAAVVCPHAAGECACRKPADGLFREALARAPWADPARCVMVGDMPSDLEPATGLGMRVVRVGPGAPIDAAVEGLLGATPDADRPGDKRRGEGHVP